MFDITSAIRQRYPQAYFLQTHRENTAIIYRHGGCNGNGRTRIPIEGHKDTWLGGRHYQGYGRTQWMKPVNSYSGHRSGLGLQNAWKISGRARGDLRPMELHRGEITLNLMISANAIGQANSKNRSAGPSPKGIWAAGTGWGCEARRRTMKRLIIRHRD